MSARFGWLALGALVAVGAFVWNCGGQNSTSDAGNDATTRDQNSPDTSNANDASNDASGDASDGGGPRCTVSKPFGAITLVAELGAVDGGSSGARLTADSLTVYYAIPGAPANGIISTATRTSAMLPFGASSPVLTLADAGLVGLDPSVSPDGLTLYTQYNPSNFVEVVYGTRLTPSGGFNYPTGVPGLSGGAPNHGAPFLQASSALWWAARVEPDGGATQGAGSLDIFVAQLTGPGAITGASAVPELTTIYDETSPALTPDGLTVYFARKEATDGGASATFHVYSSTRGVETDPFPTPALVSELDDMPTTNTQPTWIAPDDCVIYLTSDRDGPAGAIYTAARPL